MIAHLLKALANALKRFVDALSSFRRRVLYKVGLWILFFVVLLALCLLLAEKLAKALGPVVESAKDGMDGKSILMGFGLIAGLAAFSLYLLHAFWKWLKPGFTSLEQHLLHLATLRLPENLREDAQASVTEVMEILKVWGKGQKMRTTAGVFAWLATFAFAIAGVVFAVAQVAKMESQNQLLQTQNKIIIMDQEFQMDRDSANDRYNEIRDILLDLNSTPENQAFALSQLPEAMRMPVAKAKESVNQKTNATTVVQSTSFPNVDRLKSVLLAYLKQDRVGHAIAKARESGRLPKSAPLVGQAYRTVLEELEPASTALLVTLHRLGPPENETSSDDDERCLWIYHDDKQVSDAPPPMSRRWPDSGDWKGVRLTHLGIDDLQRIQAPSASVGGMMLADGANLSGAHFEYANLDTYGSKLKGANLKGAHLEFCELRGANLEGASFGGACLLGADLISANLRNAFISTGECLLVDFSNARCENAGFGGRIVSCQFNGTSLQRSEFLGCKVTASDFYQAHFEGAAF